MKKIIFFLLSVLTISCMSTKKNDGSKITLNGSWLLVEIKNDKIMLSELPTLVIDAEKKQFSGFAGCNRMGGQIQQNDNKIILKDIFSTKMLCQNDQMKVEDTYTELLAKTNSFEIKGNILSFYDKNKNKLLTFKKS